MRPELLSCPASTQMDVSRRKRKTAPPLLAWPMFTARTLTVTSSVGWHSNYTLPYISNACVNDNSPLLSLQDSWLFMCQCVGNASRRAAEPQPETRAVMDLIQERGFTLSVALDGGSVLVTYPYDKPVQSGMFWLILSFMKLHICCLCPDSFICFFSPLSSHSWKWWYTEIFGYCVCKPPSYNALGQYWMSKQQPEYADFHSYFKFFILQSFQ